MSNKKWEESEEHLCGPLTCTHKHTSARTHTYIHPHTLTHAHVHIHPYTHTHTYTLTYTYIHTHTHTHVHTHIHIYINTHMHILIYTQSLISEAMVKLRVTRIKNYIHPLGRATWMCGASLPLEDGVSRTSVFVQSYESDYNRNRILQLMRRWRRHRQCQQF